MAGEMVAARPETRRARAIRWYATRPSARLLKLVLGLAVVVVAVLVSSLVGPAGLHVRGVLLELVDALPLVRADSGLSEMQQAILWEIRLPRVVLAVLVGATLALAGTAYQGVFRNPLADPYLLGVSSGAGLGATLGIVAAARSVRWACHRSRSPAACWGSRRRTCWAPRSAAAAARS